MFVCCCVLSNIKKKIKKKMGKACEAI